MPVEPQLSKQRPDAPGPVTPGQFLSLVLGFEGPPERLIEQYLSLQCRFAGAKQGAVFQASEDSTIAPVAAFPPVERDAGPPAWWAQAAASAGEVLSEGKTTVHPLAGPDDLYGQKSTRHLITVPLGGSGPRRHLGAFYVETADAARLAAARERLELTAGLMGMYAMRTALGRRDADLRRLSAAMEVLSAVGESKRFGAASMVVCNELASRWGCERVGLGMLRGRYVRLKALSNTEKFNRKMEMVQHIEAAMEECLDQDVEILHPAAADATYSSRATGQFVHQHGPMTVLSLPLRWAGEVHGVLMLHRAADRPFGANEVEALRVTCNLCAPRILSLYEQDRWFGARAASGLRNALAAAVGAKHTWWKLVAILIAGFLVFAIFGRGNYQAQASFVLEASDRRVIPAPFDGELAAVRVKIGQLVEANAVLADLDTAELRLQLARARAELSGHLKQASSAMAEGKTAEAQIAQARARGIGAQIELLEYQKRHAQITSPIAGTVITGDLQQRIGAPVETGQVLFEVAPLGALRADLSVPEDQIADVRLKQEGYLAAASVPHDRIAFVVERIDPVARVVNQQNIFRVRVRLLEVRDWMRPGMEGVAKIHISRRSHAWLWTRRLVNWLRMKLWV